MSRRLFAFILAFALVAGVAAAQTAGLAVTVTYKGKGVVSEKNKVFVFLLDHPNPAPGSQPLAVQTVTRNGGTATFANVSQPVVYVVMVYDISGTYDGRSGPPVAGSPWAVASKAGAPLKVEAAKTPKVTVSFNDSQLWGTPAKAKASS